MTIRILLAAAVVLLIAACADSSTAPSRLSPTGASKDELTCRSGYHIATRDTGEESCEADGEGESLSTSSVAAAPDSTSQP